MSAARATAARLLIDEHIRDDSTVARTYLSRDGDAIAIDVDDARRGVLALATVVFVVRRYARPLDDTIDLDRALADTPRLDLDDGTTLALMHWRAAVDATGRDWLVLRCRGQPPLAALANGVAAALRHLVSR